MIDIPAIKARLSDPREVARLLGLRVEQKIRNGILTRCPVHNNKSGALRLQIKGGVLKMNCFGCGIYGDAIDLLAAMEGDHRRGLARAAEFAGGAAPMQRREEPQEERLGPWVYHELASQILEAGRLDGRPWVREVEAYLEERRLLEFARADGWACLPGLKWLIRLAEEVCDARGSRRREDNIRHLENKKDNKRPLVCAGVGTDEDARDESRSIRDTDRLTPHTLLVRAKLARYNDRGEFVPTWGRWRLVIPWRGPDGRISALQRRRTWKHVPRDENDPEPAKYVLPWLPDWPYGSERIGGGYGMSQDSDECTDSELGDGRGSTLGRGEIGKTKTSQAIVARRGGHLRRDCSQESRTAKIAIVEGAVDALAMRALYPSFAVLGIPGINSWRPEWARLVAGADVRYALDRGKPRQSDGLVSEDIACARIALDVAGAAWHVRALQNANGLGVAPREGPVGNHGPLAFPFTDATLDWLLSRYRRGKSLFCVLCGTPEPWLCRGCGRRRAGVGMDWGEVWRRKAAQP
jgi:hypothetical protein